MGAEKTNVLAVEDCRPASDLHDLQSGSESRLSEIQVSENITRHSPIGTAEAAPPSQLQSDLPEWPCESKISIYESRRYCTFCGKKRQESKMNLVHYKLLKKKAWHCAEHTSTAADFLQIISSEKGLFLELFSGSKEVSKIAESFGCSTFTIDHNKSFGPDLAKDIRTVKLSELPREVRFIWASIPCTVFSVLSIARHWEKVSYSWRKYFYVPKTKEAREAIQILEKTLWLIKNLNPDYFVIENPRGALRHMPQVRSIPFRHTVSYSDYGFNYYKPTDIFTNFPGLDLIKMLPKELANCAGSVLQLNGAYERSLVPGQLVKTILSQIIGKEAANG